MAKRETQVLQEFPFLCTVGRGLMTFAVEHVKTQCQASNVEEFDGKLCFCSRPSPQLLRLKFVERLYVLLGRVALPHCQASSSGTTAELLANQSFVSNLENAVDNRLLLACECKSHLASGPSCSSIEPGQKRPKTDIETSQSKPTFIISGKSTRPEAVNKRTEFTKLREAVQAAVQRVCPEWKVMETPGEEADFNILLRIDSAHCFLALSCTRRALSQRPYIRHVGLRSTACDVMLHLADIRSGSIVLDAMCGMGTLGCETLANAPNVFVLCADRSASACLHSACNCLLLHKQYTKPGSTFSVVNADLHDAYLRAGVVDVVVCDLPMGQQHASVSHVTDNVDRWIAAYERLVSGRGRCVLLTSTLLEPRVRAACHSAGLLVQAAHPIALGNTQAVALLAVKQ